MTVLQNSSTLYFVAKVLLIADNSELRKSLASALSLLELQIIEASSGSMVRDLIHTHDPDLVISDMQVSSMGGYAIALDMRLEESGGRQDHIPILILLDRRSDVFLAKRASAEGYVVKPLNSIVLRKAVQALLDGQTYEDANYKPETVPVS